MLAVLEVPTPRHLVSKFRIHSSYRDQRTSFRRQNKNRFRQALRNNITRFYFYSKRNNAKNKGCYKILKQKMQQAGWICERYEIPKISPISKHTFLRLRAGLHSAERESRPQFTAACENQQAPPQKPRRRLHPHRGNCSIDTYLRKKEKHRLA